MANFDNQSSTALTGGKKPAFRLGETPQAPSNFNIDFDPTGTKGVSSSSNMTSIGGPQISDPLTTSTTSATGAEPAYFGQGSVSMSNSGVVGGGTTGGDPGNTGTSPNIAPYADRNMIDETGTALAGAGQISNQGATAAEGARTAANVDVSQVQTQDPSRYTDAAGVRSGAGMIDNTPSALVSNQLAGLLKRKEDDPSTPDIDESKQYASEYMQTVENNAKQQAASMGLMGTTMAIGAATRAAIENGLPIAQQDAETYARAVQQEQQTYNEISKNVADGIVTSDLKHYSNTLDQAMANKNTQMNILLDSAQQSNNTVAQGYLRQMDASLNHFSQTTMANLDSKLKIMLQNQQITSQEMMQTQNLAASIISGTQAKVMDFLADPDFLSGFMPPLNANNAVWYPDDPSEPNGPGEWVPTKATAAAAYQAAETWLNDKVLTTGQSSADFVANSAGLDWSTIIGNIGFI